MLHSYPQVNRWFAFKYAFFLEVGFPVLSRSLWSNLHLFREGINFITSYFICFSQPFAIDSFQFETILDMSDSQTKYEAVFEVSISSNYDFRNRLFAGNNSRNLVKVSEAIVKESMTCNVVFDLQTVSIIKICGFRFRTDNEQIRIPLDISRVRVAVNRESNQWIEGKVLPLSSPDNSLIHQLLHSFW